jgi:hypothetical protein
MKQTKQVKKAAVKPKVVVIQTTKPTLMQRIRNIFRCKNAKK